MTDVVVTVPMRLWDEWLAEGDLPGEAWDGEAEYGAFEYGFYISRRPDIDPGDRVYIVAYGRLRGYAPLVRLERFNSEYVLVRAGGAVACTIASIIRGFQGWRYRWWEREQEQPFPDWMRP